jgi:hypothetical protein
MIHDVLQNLLRVNEKFLNETLAHDDVKGDGRIPGCSHHCTAQQFCNFGIRKKPAQKPVGTRWRQQDQSVKEERSG